VVLLAGIGPDNPAMTVTSSLQTEPLVRLDRSVLGDLERALATEWLETNGLGDYASSTVLACPTRRYHGLLVARLEGSAQRHVFLARFDEHARSPDGAAPLSVARYDETFAPDGHEAIDEFRLAPFPSSRYWIGSTEVAREVLMVQGEHVVLMRWGAHRGPVRLELKPLFACRDADALHARNDALDPTVRRTELGLTCQPYASLPAITLGFGAAEFHFEAEPVWYYGQHYSADAARGYDDKEDLWCPGTLHVELDAGRDAILAIGLGESPVADPRTLWRQEVQRRRAESASVRPDDVVARSELAADAFFARRGRRIGITAGFPWFGEWGRDAFIALPGLTLARGQVDRCEDVLAGALPYLQGGLLPNIYGLDPDDSHYGSVDAALWFARAARLWHEAPGARRGFVDELVPALEEIATAYRDGTDLGVRADAQGLIEAGSPELNPTWMDARASDGPVTPRTGCAVEINALWYSLVEHLEGLARGRGDRTALRTWRDLRRRIGATFRERFWLPEDRYLADVWNHGERDTSVRPNMVIAAALEASPLTRKERQGVVERARDELLTPRGLRTLSPRHPAFVARYEGGPDERDRAYHQGTVWPWLLGFYVEAHVRAFGTKKRDLDALRALWDAFLPELDRAGLNHVSEVFDGGDRGRPGGTIAQAWNTAELLRSCALLARSRR